VEQAHRLMLSSSNFVSNEESLRVRACYPPTGSVNSIFSNCRFEFQKRSQLFLRAHHEPLSVVAMRISDEARSALGIKD
jgi:hypothetical protein